jgi:hypothetical protein
MSIFENISTGIQRLWEAVVRIFSPSRDDYPESGTQPYEGDPYEGD